MDHNYFVSATNYGWGPDSIGDRTDIPNWPEWFTGPNRDNIMAAVYRESGQNIGDFGAWARLPRDPGGENEIIMFKSCFPNSDLYGHPNDPPLAEPDDSYTVANAKAVYNKILTYFATRQDKLFIVITAPPLMQSETTPQRAANARAFNNWLVNDWLKDYPYKNVAVFDYYNVLTSNGGNANNNDAGAAQGNHHRWWNGQIQHIQTVNNNYAAYPSGDSHPSSAGHQKATAEFVPLLNVFYHRWQLSKGAPGPAPSPTATPAPASPPPTLPAPGSRSTSIVDDMESEPGYYIDGDRATVQLSLDTTSPHAGSSSLRVAYDIAPGGWGGFGRAFDSPQDWSSGNGLELWIRAEKGGQPLALILFSGDPAAPTPFETHLVMPKTSDGWQKFALAWADFSKPDWGGAEGLAVLDPARITSYGFNLVDADGQQNTGVLWIDDIGLATGEITPPLILPPPTASPVVEPTAPPQPASPGAPASGSPCPSAALVLTLGLIITLRREKEET